jgi:RNA polymerase sigma-70 factor (ECF subfamily)
MDDSRIIELYWERSEDAISETDTKYGKLCKYIIRNILTNAQDEEECVNDTYLGIWNSIPPQKPNIFSAFIGRIARNQALKKYEYITAEKRNPDVVYSLAELEECVSGRDSVETEFETKRIEKAISDFLWKQEDEKRMVFIRRYWYFDPIAVISRRSGFSESKVTSMLYHTRQKLRAHLESEGIEI